MTYVSVNIVQKFSDKTNLPFRMNAGVGLVEARKISEVSNTITAFLPSSVNFVAILNLWKGASEYLEPEVRIHINVTNS
jgi:hypothetical protein